MSKRNSFKLVRKIVAGFALLLILLQGPLFTMASPQDPVETTPVQTTPPDNIDGYTVAVRPTEEVNAFLASSAAGGRFLDGLSSRGIYPGGVSYISLSGNAADPNNDLTLLANKINAGGGPAVSSVNMLIGAYQGADGKLDGEVLLVANLAGGGQRLLAGFQANDDNLNGNGEPAVYDGDYFTSSTQNTTNAAVIAVLICWIRCFVIQQIIIKLRCVVITIIACIRIGPFILCAKAQLIICQLIIIIRTIVVCYINCVVIVVIVKPVKPVNVNGALFPREVDSGVGNQNRQPLKSGLPFGQSVRTALAG